MYICMILFGCKNNRSLQNVDFCVLSSGFVFCLLFYFVLFCLVFVGGALPGEIDTLFDFPKYLLIVLR